jgi:hypothetical protein
VQEIKSKSPDAQSMNQTQLHTNLHTLLSKSTSPEVHSSTSTPASGLYVMQTPDTHYVTTVEKLPIPALLCKNSLLDSTCWGVFSSSPLATAAINVGGFTGFLSSGGRSIGSCSWGLRGGGAFSRPFAADFFKWASMRSESVGFLVGAGFVGNGGLVIINVFVVLGDNVGASIEDNRLR